MFSSHSFMIRLMAASLLTASGVMAPRHAAAAEPAEPTPTASPAKNSPTTEEIDGWIAELGDDAYTVRKAAGERLLDAGMPARAPLLAIVDGPDPELRAAARRLVALIDRTEFHRRLALFAADVDGRQGLTLPGWEKFRELVGGDSAARALFVEMQRHEGSLFSAVFGVSSQPAHELWEERLQRLVQRQNMVGGRNVNPPLGSCAAMVYLGSVPDMEVSDRTAMHVDHLIQASPIRDVLRPAEPSDPIRRLVVSWILNSPNQSELALQRRLSVASANGLKECTPLALALAGEDPQYLRVLPQTRAAAILVAGQLGGPEHVERLEPLLEDATACFSPGVRQGIGQGQSVVQIRDVALVVMLHLTGQQPSDYGYTRARMQPQQLFELPTLFAENDLQRTDAIEKWRTWRARQKPQPKPAD